MPRMISRLAGAGMAAAALLFSTGCVAGVAQAAPTVADEGLTQALLAYLRSQNTTGFLESFQNVTHRIPQQSQIFTSPRHSTFGRESYSITGMPLKIAAMGSQGRWLSFPARSHLGWTPSVVDAVVCGRATPAPALRRYNREETMPQLSIKGDENYGSVLPRRPKGGRW